MPGRDEPQEPGSHVQSTLLRAFEDLAVGSALPLDLRRQALEPPHVAVCPGKQQITQSPRDPTVPVIEGVQRDEPQVGESGPDQWVHRGSLLEPGQEAGHFELELLRRRRLEVHALASDRSRDHLHGPLPVRAKRTYPDPGEPAVPRRKERRTTASSRRSPSISLVRSTSSVRAIQFAWSCPASKTVPAESAENRPNHFRNWPSLLFQAACASHPGIGLLTHDACGSPTFGLPGERVREAIRRTRYDVTLESTLEPGPEQEPAATDRAGRTVRVAILDMYKGDANQGMRCLRQLLDEAGDRHPEVRFEAEEFDVRAAHRIPDLTFDLYLSSGGPGSPFDGADLPWEAEYFKLLDDLMAHNRGPGPRKFLLAICHSFQLLCIHLGLAEVKLRKSGSFGVMPVHQTEAGILDPLFGLLPEVFYGADFREWQILQPRHDRITEIGAHILALEKERPHVPLERAVMAMRISPEIVGVQFHPEADPDGMLRHFDEPERRAGLVEKHGQAKFDEIRFRIQDPASLGVTYKTFIPEFIRRAIQTQP